MTAPRKRVGTGRPAERAAIRVVQALFEDANHIYQSVLGSNDIGKDAYVDVVVEVRSPGT